MSQHDTLLAAFENYIAENEKFIGKGINCLLYTSPSPRD